MKKKMFFVTAFLAVIGGLVWAHEFFVIPREIKDYKTGDTIALDVLSTHHFMVGEEIETPASVNQVYVLQNGEKTVLTLTANQARLLYETSYKLKGDSPALLVGNRMGGYYCIFTDGSYADGKKAEVAKANSQKTIAKSRYFAKFSKTYLTPNVQDDSFKTPLGQDIEIVPVTNPANIKKGSTAEFQVLYKGKPLVGAEVSATYDSYDNKTENKYALTAKTNKKGEVKFKIGKSGIWLVRVSDTRASNEADVDEENLAAIVVFSVK
ncbi:MAG: DUF4198 domain-containing protein [Spirochaetaceae bacterium]|jgi:uncharacterized GH25 family protein|nr:DUF4198 domain-containing protein [Spirochaetaceae bacterium]